MYLGLIPQEKHVGFPEGRMDVSVVCSSAAVKNS